MIRPTTTDEAVMLLWDRLFGNGIEGAIPRMERSLVELRKGQERNQELISEEKQRLTDYIHTREETCPLMVEKEKKGVGTARLMGIIFGMNGVILGITMLVLRLVHVI